MATPGQLQMYNKMEISEMFSLDHRAFDTRYGAIRRIQIWPDEKVPDAVVFKIWLEDHTLGNILRMELLRNENVLFAGYKVPHPLDHMIELRVQTLPKSNPQTALRSAIRNLRGECRSMLEQFDQGVAALKRGEKHVPGVPELKRFPEGHGLASPEHESSDHPLGGTSDDAFARTNADETMQDMPDRFQEQIDQLQQLDSWGRNTPSYSPTSPLAAPPTETTPAPMDTPGLTPGSTPGLTPGLTPGPEGADSPEPEGAVSTAPGMREAAVTTTEMADMDVDED